MYIEHMWYGFNIVADAFNQADVNHVYVIYIQWYISWFKQYFNFEQWTTSLKSMLMNGIQCLSIQIHQFWKDMIHISCNKYQSK